MSLGKRLREERERMGFSQPKFAALAGTTKQTLFSWESGKTAPDGLQLGALDAAGADVLYIITGADPTGLHARWRALAQIACGQPTPGESEKIEAAIAAASGQPSPEMAARIRETINEADATRLLTPDEAALLDNYRHSPKEAQDAIKATSAAFAKRPGRRSA